MEVINININKLKLNNGQIKDVPKNPRFIKDDRFAKLKKSIEDFPEMLQYREIICYDNDGELVIVGGNMRFRACKELGYKEVPVKILPKETDAKRIREFIIKDNVSFGNNDIDILNNEFDEIELEDWGIELEELGMDMEPEIIEDDFEVPEVNKIKTDIVRGDLFEIYKNNKLLHKVLCGDSTNIDDVKKLIGEEKADMVFTDPPYGVSYEKKTKDIFKNTRYTAIANDDLKADDFAYFINDVFINVCAFLKDSGSYYIFSCQGGDQEMMMMMMRQNNIKCRHQLIWVKDSPVFSMGRLDYDYKHEPILYGWKKNHVFYRNGNQDKSVWQFKRTENKLHPTMKPVELIENAILNSTEKDMLVVDYFLGSGSTLIACEKTKRVCYGMEISPKYCDVIVKRYEDFTGKKAVLEG